MISKQFYENTTALFVYLLSMAAEMAELSNCDRDYVAYKVENIYCRALHRKMC